MAEKATVQRVAQLFNGHTIVDFEEHPACERYILSDDSVLTLWYGGWDDDCYWEYEENNG